MSSDTALLPTPLELAPESLAPGRVVYLKREDVHELGAFKWRGALPTLEQYRREGASVVVTASTGNHGSATAWAARRLGLDAVVYAPEEVSRTKLELMGELGAEVRLWGADVDDSKDKARSLGRRAWRAVFRGWRRIRTARRVRGDRQRDSRAASRTACCRRRSRRKRPPARRDRLSDA